MGANWMRSKLAKQRKERRAWARPYSIKSSGGPVWANQQQMREGSDVDFLTKEAQSKAEYETRHARVPDISEVRKDIPDPFFTKIVDTPVHRCRIYYDSRRSIFILQYVHWKDKTVQLSCTYPSFHVAHQRWLSETVKWKTLKYF